MEIIREISNSSTYEDIEEIYKRGNKIGISFNKDIPLTCSGTFLIREGRLDYRDLRKGSFEYRDFIKGGFEYRDFVFPEKLEAKEGIELRKPFFYLKKGYILDIDYVFTDSSLKDEWNSIHFMEIRFFTGYGNKYYEIMPLYGIISYSRIADRVFEIKGN